MGFPSTSRAMLAYFLLKSSARVISGEDCSSSCEVEFRSGCITGQGEKSVYPEEAYTNCRTELDAGDTAMIQAGCVAGCTPTVSMTKIKTASSLCDALCRNEYEDCLRYRKDKGTEQEASDYCLPLISNPYAATSTWDCVPDCTPQATDYGSYDDDGVDVIIPDGDDGDDDDSIAVLIPIPSTDPAASVESPVESEDSCNTVSGSGCSGSSSPSTSETVSAPTGSSSPMTSGTVTAAPTSVASADAQAPTSVAGSEDLTSSAGTLKHTWLSALHTLGFLA
eukprot:CAMPEP_0197845238 /NCGR_PEP_ID=MMETSP1438-20131217/2183_1 /TAXON_ID=1461541 /ORGANISM="Pterosperma sp., Strain CCMP1384" /LENGTH=279 /DNA_ID=CAMNT_0043456431 /DNA_START=147 /DNA_END=983 /DNA_ORIENTATION=+